MILDNADWFKLRDESFFKVLVSWLKSNKEDYTIELIEVEQDSAVTLCTQEKKEVIFVINGEGGIFVDGEGGAIKFGDFIYVPSKSIRTLANIKDKPLWIVSILYTANF